jgi:hypothetical protein
MALSVVEGTSAWGTAETTDSGRQSVTYWLVISSPFVEMGKPWFGAG